jgi:hypothetical protein
LSGPHHQRPSLFGFLKHTLRIQTQPTLAVCIHLSAREVLRAANAGNVDSADGDECTSTTKDMTEINSQRWPPRGNCG